MSCASLSSKYFLCFFNFAFFLAGGAALTVGLWLLIDQTSLVNLIGNLDETNTLKNTDAEVIRLMAYISVAAGALTFIVSLLGYCGAMFESRVLLSIYGVLILVALILECVVVGLAFGLKEDAKKGSQDFLKSTIKYYGSKEEMANTIKFTWDGMMNQLHCCGVESYKDFQVDDTALAVTTVVPDACCKKLNGLLVDTSCPTAPTVDNSYFEEGCYDKIIENLEANATMAIGIAVVLLFVEVLLITMALYLACCYWRPQHVLTGWCC